MPEGPVELLGVDEVRCTIVMDNVTDLLMPGTEVARRLPLPEHPFERPVPRAEHGFSVLVTVRRGEREQTVLFDTGISRTGILHNLDALEADLSGLRAVVISHGHPDHCMGLPGLLDRLGRRGMPLVLHPEAYLQRKVVLPSGNEVNLPPPDRNDLRREEIELIETESPSLLLDGMLLVSGEVPRTTAFERGFPIHYAKRNGVWEPDPWIRDDQCIIARVEGRGLVIVSGCAHAGIINVVRNAQSLTGIREVHAVIGGFHLTGGIFEEIIPDTIEALREIGPRYLVPSHCTGWSAMHQIAGAMPDAFLPNCVGTTFVL